MWNSLTGVNVPEPTVMATEYSVSCLPLDHPEGYNFTIHVAWRGPGDVWAVINGSRCLSSTGEWDYEPSPSNREDDWKETHRYPLERALELARQQAPLITCNRHTVADAIALHEQDSNP